MQEIISPQGLDMCALGVCFLIILFKEKRKYNNGDDRMRKEKGEAEACLYTWTAALFRVPIIWDSVAGSQLLFGATFLAGSYFTTLKQFHRIMKK